MHRRSAGILVLFVSLLFLIPVSVTAQSGQQELLITHRSPEGENDGQVQIQVLFNKPVVPLGTLDDPARKQVLSNFIISPPVAGAFRLLGTNAVVFEPKHHLTLATEYRVTVRKGIRAIDGSVLQADLSWTFRTPGPRILYIQPNNTDRAVPDQEISIATNQALDAASLRERTRFVTSRLMARDEPVAFEIVPAKDNPAARSDLGMERRQYRYVVKQRAPLSLETKYSVFVEAGVRAGEGNLTTPASASASFKTYGPFRFLRIEPVPRDSYGNLEPSYQLVFTNGVAQEEMDKNAKVAAQAGGATMTEKITDKLLDFFSKATKGKERRATTAAPEGSFFLAYRSQYVRVNNANLEPDRDYEIALLKDLTDVYGQKLENPQDVRFHSGDLQPAVVVRKGMYVISRSVDPRLPVGVQAVDKLYSRITSLTPQDLLGMNDLRYGIDALAKKGKGDYIVTQGVKERNVPMRHEFDLKPRFNRDGFGAVLYDFYSPDERKRHSYFRGSDIHHTGLIFRTDLGAHFKISPKEGLLLVNSLQTGSAVPGVRVDIYREDNSAKSCASGATDGTGIWKLGAQELLACTKRNITAKVLSGNRRAEADEDDEMYDSRSHGQAGPPRLSVLVSKGTDWTFLQAQGEGNPPVWNFGVSPAWEAERPIAAGVIFSDRRIYRLGETVELKGVARYLSYGELKKEAGTEYEISLTDPHGSRTKLPNAKVNEFGSFHINLPIKKNQSLGHYTVTATSKKLNLQYTGTFQVAQFRAPDFKASVTPGRSLVVSGEELTAEVKGEYFFGAPMGGARASWNVTRQRTMFRPAGWEGMFFGIPSWIDEETPAAEPSANVASNWFDLDRDGKGMIRIAVPAGDVKRPMIYSFDVEVKDPSEQTVGAASTATVLPYPVLAGIKMGDWFGEAKKPLSVQVIAVNADGTPRPGTAMKVKLIKRDWHSVRRVIRPGQEATETKLVETVAGTCEVVSGSKPVACSVTPPAAGYYIVQAGFKDRENAGTEAKLTFYASGREMVGWSGTEYDRVEIVLDKKSYEPGETARALIKSPYPRAEMLFTVEREKFFSKERRQTEGGAVIVDFTVTKEMIPNAYVGVVLVRTGATASGQEPDEDHQFKVGYAPFSVSAEEKRLQVAVAPERSSLKPGEELSVDFTVKDRSGRPVDGEVVVMVVDEAILALTGYTPPDLVSIIYPHRGLSMRMSDNRRFLLNQQKFSEKGNDGGGGGEMESAVAVRQIFQNLAYYNPSLRTGPDGKASVRFKLPDNLTQWRVMAVAITKDDRFGDGKAPVTVSLPLTARPVTPRFTRIGDSFKAGVTVQVSGDAGGDVTITATLPDKNSAVAFAGTGGLTTTIAVKPGETRKVLFPYRAAEAGSAPLRFTARFEGRDRAGNRITHDDAVQVTLAVQDLPPTETTVAVGETDKESKEKLNVPKTGIRSDTGGLTITLASTALAQLDEGAQFLVAYPYGCLEQRTSLLLPLMQLHELSSVFKFDLTASKPIPEVIKANLAMVLSLQNSDGGFRYWSSDSSSDRWISPYVAKLLARAEGMHYDIPKAAKEKLGGFLQQSLRDFSWYMRLCSWRCKAYYRLNILTGMRELGLSDESYYQDYYSRRKELGLDAQIQLAALLTHLPKWKEQSATLFEEIKKGMFITAATAHIEDRADLPPSWGWMTSPVINTGRALSLFLLREPDHPFNAKMARYILQARKNGRWRTTYENAAALDALLDVLKKKEKTEPDYRATVLLAGKNVLEADRKGYDTKLVEGSVEAKDLPIGKSDLVIKKKGKGSLYYTLRYSYKLTGPQPPRQEGFYVERKISRFDPVKSSAAEKESLQEIPLGQVAVVELTIIVPQAAYRFVVDDPLPAGLEPIDRSLKTTSQRYQVKQGEEDEGEGEDSEEGYEEERGSYRSNPFNHVELHDEGVKLFADEIAAGVYRYRYLARATTPGIFELPGTVATLMYEPEQFGRAAEGTFKVTE
jgi:alpha-2-macroglobulin